jgi:hypothetical protein
MNDRHHNSTVSPVGDASDRRRAPRYPIAAAARFERQDASGRWHEAIGITRDIGRAGLFVEAEVLPPVASLVRFTVTMPASENGAVTLRLGGVGEVRHCQHGPAGGTGFGASVVWHLKTPEPKEPAK